MSARPRVAIVGIDCLTPQLLFDRYLDALPTFQHLVTTGTWGLLRSTTPPITIPAWSCMATSQDPGQLGIYGFRNRLDHSYRDMSVVDASWLKAPTVWQILSRQRKRSCVLGVPLTYPARPIVGDLVCGIPVPADATRICSPDDVQQFLRGDTPERDYQVDVGDFRTRSPESLLQALQHLRDQRFDVAAKLWARGPELMFMVDMSVDRLHHAFWAHAHPEHPLHDPKSAFKDAMKEFYVGLDTALARLLSTIGDDTHVLIVSDHGARTMYGGIRFNEWLIQHGYLKLKQRPQQARRLRNEDIDWSASKAWADGGYYSRVFFNVRGREPEGQVEDVDAFARELTGKLEDMQGPHGKPLHNRVFLPRQVYQKVNNIAPDLIVYPGDLDYRANATVLPSPLSDDIASNLFALENDTGVDGANHDQHGILIFRPAARAVAPKARRLDATLYDVAPTTLSLLGMPIPPHMIGHSIV